jgi:hypothetical protein
MKRGKSDGEEPITSEVPLLSFEGLRRAAEGLVERRKLVDPAKLRETGQAYEHYEAGLRSRWDSYEGAIAAAEGDPDPLVDGKRARKPNPDRLVDCLRAHKPLVGRDRDLLAAYFATRIRRRRWPRWRENAVSQAIAADDYDLLADLVAKVGRKRGRVANAPAHRVARLATELLSLVRLARELQSLGRELGLQAQMQEVDYARRDSVIDYAREVEGGESEGEIASEQDRKHPVVKLLNNPGRIRPR